MATTKRIKNTKKDTKFARLLLSKGVSGIDIRKATGLVPSQISMIRNGYQNITTVTLVKLCVFFKCSPNDILDWEKWLETAEKHKQEATT